MHRYQVIVPYFEEHWNYLSAREKPKNNKWHSALKRAMLREAEIFMWEGNADGPDSEDMIFGLKETGEKLRVLLVML